MTLRRFTASIALAIDSAALNGCGEEVGRRDILVAARLLPDIGKHSAKGKHPQGTTLGVLSLAIGILNAACMTC